MTDVLRISASKLRGREFLVDELYWDEEGWLILVNEDPILEWEMSLNHNYSTTVIEPTCDQYGFTIYICADCNSFFIRDFVMPHGHNYEEEITVAPSCLGEGYTYAECTKCDHIEITNRISPLGHTKGELTDSKEPTCTEDGSYFGVFWSWRSKVEFYSDPLAKNNVGWNLGEYN